MKPEISVIICTYSPRADIFALVLQAIDRQRMAKDQFEVIIVDNNSPVPLDENEINRNHDFKAKVIREPRQGNVFGRQTAIKAANADVLVFIDDDNIPDPDYLEVGLRIMREHPEIGACGGIARGRLEKPVDPWQEPLLGFVGVKDYGEMPITSRKDRWGKWEPIGAGMVFRKSVGMKYVEMVEQLTDVQKLGRKGGGLLAGEDSLIARMAYRMGLACSYQPALKMDHFIKSHRLEREYLRRLLLGHGRSRVLLDRALGKNVRPMSRIELWARYIWQKLRWGKAADILWQNDLGYFLESRGK